MEFTKEQLIRRAHLTVSRGARELENHPDRDGVAADIKISSIAARALMAEPIYQLWDEGYYDTEKEIYDAALKAGGRGRIVYTAPPAPVSVPDEDLLHMAASAIEDLLSNKDRSGAGVWADVPAKLRHAAMLQGGDNKDYRVIVERIAEIVHGKVSDIELLTVTVKSMKDNLHGRAKHVTTAYKLPEETGSSLQLRNLIRQRHAEWSQATFGDVGPVGPLKHLSKEALEAAEEPEDLSEWADMQFLLWDAQRRAGISDGEITAAMEEKLKVNMSRQWPEPKEGEPRQHIKAAPQQEAKP